MRMRAVREEAAAHAAARRSRTEHPDESPATSHRPARHEGRRRSPRSGATSATVRARCARRRASRPSPRSRSHSASARRRRCSACSTPCSSARCRSPSRSSSSACSTRMESRAACKRSPPRIFSRSAPIRAPTRRSRPFDFRTTASRTSTADRPERVYGRIVSAGFFSTLGVRPISAAPFQAGDQRRRGVPDRGTRAGRCSGAERR